MNACCRRVQGVRNEFFAFESQPWIQVLAGCLTVILALVATPALAQCQRNLSAEVVALDQPFFWNRLETPQRRLDGHGALEKSLADSEQRVADLGERFERVTEPPGGPIEA